MTHEPAASAPAEATQAKILLVDDLEENLVALSAILGSLGHPLVRVRSGEAALKALLRGEFAMVLLDVVMPGMDGFETAAHIKRLDKTKDVPIIFLTGVDDGSGYASRGYAVGAVDYLTKPFDPWVLRAKVAVFIDLYLKNRRIRELREQMDDVNLRLASVEHRLKELAADSAPLTTLGSDISAVRRLLDSEGRSTDC